MPVACSHNREKILEDAGVLALSKARTVALGILRKRSLPGSACLGHFADALVFLPGMQRLAALVMFNPTHMLAMQ